MYLLPTNEDIARLYCFINPKTRFLLAAQEAINELTKDSMPYFDEIEDDIISMKRDINGFKISRPRYLEHNPNSGHLNFKGWSFEYVPSKKEFPDGPGVEHASSWDEI